MRRKKNAFGTLLGMLIVLVIIGIVSLFFFRTYFHPASIHDEDAKALSSEGIDASNYKSIIDDTTRKVDVINRQMREKENTYNAALKETY